MIEKNFKGLMGSNIQWKKIPGKGRGVFALKKIKKGAIVEIAPVTPMSKKNVPPSEAPDGLVIDWDGSKKGKEYAIVFGYVMLYNHSDEPNIELESDLGEMTITVTALRDIKAGEELAWDYGVDLWFRAK